MDRVFRIGIVGYGYAARSIHIPLLVQSPGFEIAAVVERTEKKANAECSALVAKPMRECTSLEELLQVADIDLVLVCTPNHLHFEQARAALLAGKHVLVDKPLAVFDHEARELAGLAKQQNRVLSVFHNRVYDADFLAVRQILGEGSLGALAHAELRWQRFVPQPRPKPWKENGQVGNELIDDLGSHLIAAAVSLWGMPHRLACAQARLRPTTSINDAFWLKLWYKNGLIVDVSSSLLAQQALPRWSLYGNQTAVHLWESDIQEDQLKTGVPVTHEQYGHAASRTVPYPRGNWPMFYRDLYTTLSAPGPKGPDRYADLAVNVATIISLARLSDQQGKTIDVTTGS